MSSLQKLMDKKRKEINAKQVQIQKDKENEQIERLKRSYAYVGDEYKSNINKLTFGVGGGCSSCSTLLQEMNEEGPEWCEEKRDYIITTTIENSKRIDSIWINYLLKAKAVFEFLADAEEDEIAYKYLDWCLTKAIETVIENNKFVDIRIEMIENF